MKVVIEVNRSGMAIPGMKATRDALDGASIHRGDRHLFKF